MPQKPFKGLSPFELVFVRKPRQLTSFEMPKLNTIEPEYREFFKLLMEKSKMYRDMDLQWRQLQALELQNKNRMFTNIETFAENDIVYLLVPHTSALQSSAQKFRQDYVGPLAIDTKTDDTHYFAQGHHRSYLKRRLSYEQIEESGRNNPRGCNKKL